MEELMLRIDNVSKRYVLGQIGGTTLRDELQRWSAKVRGKEDPTKQIGTKDYNRGETFFALDGVSFDVRKGERVGIIGHNGAGKSTLLKLVSRVTAPTSGKIGINGRVTSMLEVGTGFHPELTGRENIYMNGAILGMTKAEIDRKVEDIIDFSECRQFIDTPVKRYSSGMYVKLAFSVAAHLDSEMMIMDEVLAVGDMKFQKKCLGRMGDVSSNEGKTILYVSHNMSTIRSICTRCIVLQKGKVVFDGDVEEAISIYLKGLESTEFFKTLDCADLNRRDSLGRKCHISYYEFVGVEKPEYEAGEPLCFRVKCDTNSLCQDVIGRAVFRSMDGEVFAMTESNVIRQMMGQQIIDFCFCTKNLPKGKYLMTFSLNEISEFGEYEMLDEISKMIPFVITEDRIYGEYKSAWISNYWGKIRLDPMSATMTGGSGM